MSVEFNVVRSKSYKSAIKNFPDAWNEDMSIMKDYLLLEPGQRVVEIGAGSGFFSFEISERIGDKGKLLIVEPSLDQLFPLIEKNIKNMEFFCTTAEDFKLPTTSKIDRIWSRGAFHHVTDKTKVMSNLASISEKKARCVIFDIFTGSPVANFFDTYISQACTTGHQVSFLSKEFAVSLCVNSGWEKPQLIDIPLKWKFKNKEDVGVFLSMLLSIKPEYSLFDTLEAAEKILGIKETEHGVFLNWPMTLMITKKA